MNKYMPWILLSVIIGLVIWVICDSESVEASYDPGMWADPVYWNAVDTIYISGPELYFRICHMSLKVGEIAVDSTDWYQVNVQQ